MVIAFFAGALIGVPLGWSILYILEAIMTRSKRPLTKEEWKEWF